MKNNQHIPSRFKVLTPLGKKVIILILSLFGFGASLFAVDLVWLRPNCDPSARQNQTICVSSDIVTQFYASFFTAALSIWGIELVLREETIQEIEKIFNANQAVKDIDAFYFNNDDYHQLQTMVANSIAAMKEGETIKMLLFSEDFAILKQIGGKKIKEKIRSKCRLEILVVHPESSLLNCLENVQKRKSALQAEISEFCQIFNTKLIYDNNPDTKITGSLEIRCHQNVFSPFCYLSGQKKKLVWMYFFDKEGSLQYPGFSIPENNKLLIDAAEEHFKKLWFHTSNEIALKLDRDEQNNVVYDNKYDPYNDDPQAENNRQV